MRRRLLLALATLAAVAVLTASASPAPLRRALTRLPSAPLKILTMGDSITVGTSAGPSRDGYRTELSRLLTWAGVPHQIAMAAYGGWMTTDLLHEAPCPAAGGEVLRYARCQVLTLQPDVVVLDIGTNDAANSQQQRDAFGGPHGHYRWVLDEILAGRPGVKIIASFLQISTQPAWLGPLESQLNDRIYEVIVPGGAFGSPLADGVVGVCSFYRLPSGYLVDGVHPGEWGYDAMGWLVYQQIAAWLDLPGGG